MSKNISDIVYRFAQQARIILKNKLSKIILYGSYARGDYHTDSDIDIMILVNDLTETEICVMEELLCDIALDIELETGFHIAAFIKNEVHFKKWEETLPFYLNVKKEGVEINEF